MTFFTTHLVFFREEKKAYKHRPWRKGKRRQFHLNWKKNTNISSHRFCVSPISNMFPVNFLHTHPSKHALIKRRKKIAQNVSFIRMFIFFARVAEVCFIWNDLTSIPLTYKKLYIFIRTHSPSNFREALNIFCTMRRKRDAIDGRTSPERDN